MAAPRVQVVLPFSRETKGTVVYAVSNLKSQAVGQVYINKEHLEQTGGQWPGEVTITIEPGNTTQGEQTA
jgi:hypothetical protein